MIYYFFLSALCPLNKFLSEMKKYYPILVDHFACQRSGLSDLVYTVTVARINDRCGAEFCERSVLFF